MHVSSFLPYLVVCAEFLGGKGLQFFYQQGAGIVVAVGRAARRIFIVTVSGCGPTMVLDTPPALKFPVFLN